MCRIRQGEEKATTVVMQNTKRLVMALNEIMKYDQK
jgi:hypothetical protein